MQTLSRAGHRTLLLGPAALLVTALLLALAAAPRSALGQGVAPDDRGRAVGLLQHDWETATSLRIDRGWLGLAQAIRDASTTASLLHITGHPDDEHAGMLTLESRGRGTRTALVSLNRGEGGANALGPELFDALGAIRTEELLLAGRWYGLDDLYFTTAVDYGYSKTIDEAYRSWDREAVLEDLVRIIRMNRPLVVVSRWHGSVRDGHGHHQAAGDLAIEAAAAAGDPDRFPQQLIDGLRPWTALRVFRGGLRDGESADVTIKAGVYAPEFGQTYQDLAAFGLSLQRSQTSGRIRVGGRGTYAYELVSGAPLSSVGGNSFFEGLDTSLRGLPGLLGEPESAQAEALLTDADAALATASGSALRHPETTVTALVAALAALNQALQEPILLASRGSEAGRVLRATRHQIERALAYALGLEFTATTKADGVSPTRVAAGDPFEVEVQLAVRPSAPASLVRPPEVTLEAPAGWLVERIPGEREGSSERLGFNVTVGPDATPTTPYFDRTDIRVSQYTVRDSAALGQAWSLPPLQATATLHLEGLEPFTVRSAVRGVQPALPFGARRHQVGVAPPVVVDFPTGIHVTPASQAARPFEMPVVVRQGGLTPVSGILRVHLPDGWTIENPGALRFELSRPSESRAFTLHIVPSPGHQRPARIVAEAVLERAGPNRFGAGERAIRYPDLAPRYLSVPAVLERVVIDVTAPVDLSIGYVMGAGDAIPDALQALGMRVDLLDPDDVASGDLSEFDAVFIGTRAYAVRPELAVHNDRLLSYARAGGHVVVLYQTPEYNADLLAPFHALLPRNAEETSEEDAPVALLESEHLQLTWPNAIAVSDFDDWVEQRGSKFFSDWGPEFTPLVETADQGQSPQQGIWLTGSLGDGAFTYCALALHRQTPYGVEGAFKILANLASYSRRAR